MKLDQAFWTMTQKLYNEGDHNEIGDCIPVGHTATISTLCFYGERKLTSIFLASVIRLQCTVKPTHTKYTGCNDVANPKYRKQDKWIGNEKMDLRFIQALVN